MTQLANNIQLLNPLHLDDRNANYVLNGSIITIETVPQYLTRVVKELRQPGMLIVLISNPEVIDIANFRASLANRPIEWYTFKNALEDEDFVPMKLGDFIPDTSSIIAELTAIFNNYVSTAEYTSLFQVVVANYFAMNPITNGVDGRDGIDGVDGKDGVDGIGIDGIDGRNGTDGTNGREIEISTYAGYIVWKYVDEVLWHNLANIPSDGIDGEDGRVIELLVVEGYLCWRYVGDTPWIQLYQTSSGGVSESTPATITGSTDNTNNGLVHTHKIEEIPSNSIVSPTITSYGGMDSLITDIINLLNAKRTISYCGILSGLSSRNVSVIFSVPFTNIPVGRKNIHAYRLFEADANKFVDLNVIIYNLNVTTNGFSFTIDDSESLSGIIIEYDFKEEYTYIANAYVNMSLGVTFIRKGIRSSMFVVDKTITSLGFSGIEDVDWTNIKTLII